MFYLNYVFAELRRRRGRTLMTALGLGVGVALVVAVSALSAGLDDAQDEVLEPLTGVGTDMSVSRPITVDEESGEGPFGGLSANERDQLLEENGGGMRQRIDQLGEPGEKFSRDDFVSTAQLSFPQSTVGEIAGIDGVAKAAGALTLNALHVEGEVPDIEEGQGPAVQEFRAAPPGGGQAAPRLRGGAFDVDSRSVSGVDLSAPELGLVTPGEVTEGSYFSGDGRRQMIVNAAYANRNDVAVGDEVKLGERTYDVVGLARTPLGGDASDLYVELGELQALADRKGRVNIVRVRATGSDAVASVGEQIEALLEGAEVTTAADLADRVSGSLTDARDIAEDLGSVLVVVALAAAVLIASLLTLSSVSKRTRELGTLKAIGWTRWAVVRQVTGETLAQGALGGVLGAALGIGAAALIGALAPTLEASVAGPEPAAGPGGPGGPMVALFGQGAVTSGSRDIALSAPVDAQLLLLAIGLALAGGLVAGAAGGLRAARLRPAMALRAFD